MKNATHRIVVAGLFVVVVAMASGIGDEGRLPDFDGAAAWLNSASLNSNALHGKVVVVNFWTHPCINSLRQLPYMKALAAKHKDAGLVVIGVAAGRISA